jgi:hypothetical protein
VSHRHDNAGEILHCKSKRRCSGSWQRG